jgi:nitronate monooxygenase
MWPSNQLTQRLNLDWPILQAPIGGLVTPSLAAAVSNAGALGGLGMWGFSREDGARRVAAFRQQSGRSLNLNYPLWDDPGDQRAASIPMRETLQPLFDEKGLSEVPQPAGGAGAVTADHLAMIEEIKPEVVSFHFGLPNDAILAAIKATGAFIISSANTVREAKELEARGVDAVIAQGAEAGGHRGTFTGVDIAQQPGLFSLLPQVVDAVSVPVIAVGSVSDGRTAAAAFMLGASAVQIGTAFLRCEETDISDVHQNALDTATDEATIVTDVITGRPARFIKNRLIETLQASGLPPLPMPAQLSLTRPLLASGDRSMAALFSGQSAALTRRRPAVDLIEALARETGERLKAFT